MKHNYVAQHLFDIQVPIVIILCASLRKQTNAYTYVTFVHAIVHTVTIVRTMTAHNVISVHTSMSTRC